MGLDDPTGKSDEEFKKIIAIIDEKILSLREKLKCTKDSDNCPLCNNQGTLVSRETVEHLVKDEYSDNIVEDQYLICMNEDCKVIYYSVASCKKFLINQVKVPVWFKRDANPKYACYCSKVTEEQIINAVVKKGAKTIQEVNAATGAMENANCKVNNPLGICCHKTIQEAIDKGLKIK